MLYLLSAFLLSPGLGLPLNRLLYCLLPIGPVLTLSCVSLALSSVEHCILFCGFFASSSVEHCTLSCGFVCIKLCGALHLACTCCGSFASSSVEHCILSHASSSAEHCSYLTLVDQCVHEGSVGETPRSPIREFPCPHLSSHLFIVSPLGLHNPSGHMQSY